MSAAPPTEQCDLIMEGGITSGVVYPAALIQLAQRYTFRSIGGTSAGAIAAAVAAAAEYGRAHGAFTELAKLPKLLAQNLLSLFQPTRKLRGVFKAFLSVLNRRTSPGKALAATGHLALTFWWAVVIGALPALVYPWEPWDSTSEVLRNVIGIAALVATIVSLVLFFLVRRLRRELPKATFGICPGSTQSGYKKPALTNWLADYLDQLAGLQQAGNTRALTFGDLRGQGITLQMMTTNLSMQRPYRLPMAATRAGDDPEYAFSKTEWARYFPTRVIDQLTTRPVSPDSDYHWLPEPDDLPVIVAVRMSLSFPILLSAIPLYRKDRSYRHEPSQIEVFRRCIFSDGGITSNFPIHFFDSVLPTRPTFAISLEAFVGSRHGPDPTDPKAPRTNRVYMPRRAGGGINLPIQPVENVLAFIGAIVTSARVWQDRLQSVLSGYRERIVHVALDSREGGLNLNMDQKRITALTTYGELAGEAMLGFDHNEHRWRRFLVAYARIEQSLEEFHDAYHSIYGDFLVSYPDQAQSYKPVSQRWLDHVRERVQALFDLVKPWRTQPLRDSGRIPKPESALRITPRP